MAIWSPKYPHSLKKGNYDITQAYAGVQNRKRYQHANYNIVLCILLSSCSIFYQALEEKTVFPKALKYLRKHC